MKILYKIEKEYFKSKLSTVVVLVFLKDAKYTPDSSVTTILQALPCQKISNDKV